MRTAVAALLLLFCACALAQVDDATDLDWQAEMDLFNRFNQAQDYAGAYVHAQKSLAIAQRKHLGPRYLAGSDSAMGEALRQQRKYAEAERLQREALRLRESVLPPTHYRVLESVHALGLTLYAEEKYDEADPLFVRAVAGFNAMPDRDGPQECALGAALADLGKIRLRQQKYDQGEGLLRRALKSWDAIGPQCGEMHWLFDTLAWLYQTQGFAQKVEPLYQQAIRDLAPEAGEQPDPHYPHYMNQLADFYVQRKRYADAEPLLKRSLALLETTPLTDKALLEHALSTYVRLLQGSGRTAEVPAMQARLDALHHATAELGTRVTERWDADVALATQAMEQQRWDAAEKAYRDALALNATLPPTDSRYLTGYMNLVGFYESRQRPDDARAVLQQGVDAIEKASAPAADAALLFEGLVAQHLRVGDQKGAEAVLRRALAYRAKWKLAPDMGELSLLSNFMRTDGDLKQALALGQQALRAGEQQFGADGFPLVQPLEGLGLAYEANHQFALAEQAYRRMLALEEKQFGPNHVALSGPLSHLVTVYRLEGKTAEAAQAEARQQALQNAPAH